MNPIPFTRVGSLGLALAGGLTLAQGQLTIYDQAQFSAGTALALQGDASVVASRLQLAPATADRAGGAWFPTRRYLAGGFETTFTFQITGGSGDGFAFVVQNNAVPALGPAGPGLGYDGVPNSLAVEFDLTANPGLGEPAGSHLSIHTGGTGPNSAAQTSSLGSLASGLPNWADGLLHTGRVAYAAGNLSVHLDGQAAPALQVPISLEATLALDRGQAWFGFTAASGTGAAIEIRSWSMTLADQPVSVSLATPLNGASFLAPGTVFLSADAASGAGTITRVEYHAAGRRVGTASNGIPWGVSLQNLLPGTYQFVATAFDNGGRTNLSSPVTVTVVPADGAIGINFASGTGANTFTMDPTDLAGVVPQRHWNNLVVFTNGDGGALNLKDAFGSGTPVDVTVNFAGSGENPAVNPAISGGHQLARAYVSDVAGTPGFQTNSTITVSQIPFTIYDVIVYADTDNGGIDKVGRFRVGNTNVFLRDAPWASYSGIHAEATGSTDAGPATSAGNYVRFNSLTSNSFTINVTARPSADGQPRVGVNGLQIVPSVYDASSPPFLTRGPYLQSATRSNVLVRWRSNRPVESRVRFGTVSNALNTVVDDGVLKTEHTVRIDNLTPGTRYYYSIGTSNLVFSGAPTNFFWTHPATNKPTRIWVLGDSGTANTNAAAVRNAYLSYAGNRYTDVWLMLGDNAYNSGTDGEFQNAVFNFYPSMLRQTALWSCVGNHETAQSHSPNIATVPYFNIHNFPVNGEAGGLASGTERYYSFDYGNIHFVCLDAMTSDRTTNGPQYAWLEQDLAANTNTWLIAFFHHPPYTKGSHDSDDPNGADFELVEMRQNIVPLLEAYGVDLVLSGHSHCYERSFLLNGHYGYSTNLAPANLVDPGNGRTNGTGAYVKSSAGPNPYAGTVYVVAGSSGQATFGTLDHPAMYIGMLRLGSLILDVNGNRLDAAFLGDTADGEGTYGILDSFTILKPPPGQLALFRVASVEAGAGQVRLSWDSIPGRKYAVQRAYQIHSPVWEEISGQLTATSGRSFWTGPATGGQAFYRVVAQEEIQP